MKWKIGKDETYYFRECGRYYICRSLAFDINPNGHWVYVAWFKPFATALAEVIPAEQRLDTFEQAVAVCGAHLKARGGDVAAEPAIPIDNPHSFADAIQRTEKAA